MSLLRLSLQPWTSRLCTLAVNFATVGQARSPFFGIAVCMSFAGSHKLAAKSLNSVTSFVIQNRQRSFQFSAKAVEHAEISADCREPIMPQAGETVNTAVPSSHPLCVNAIALLGHL